jgi:predicted  nucleic acid-binding Zn-ribbon protein
MREEFKANIQKKEAKSLKYKDRCSKLAKEIEEQRSKTEEAERRVQAAKIKMEARLQEKEFKIIGLKQQIKQLALIP